MLLHVAALELPARFGQPHAVLEEVDRLLREAPVPALALLPEASLTGYVSPALDFDLRPFAEPLDGPTARSLSDLARAHACHLAGPLIELAEDHAYNAMVVFGPDGKLVAHYRKRHPWLPETWATPGTKAPPVFDVAGTPVTLATCFDVHFLGSDAVDELEAASVLLFPSAWVEERDSRARRLTALARRFHLAIVNANWGVGDPHVLGQGSSRILNRDGSVLAMARAAGRIDARIEVG